MKTGTVGTMGWAQKASQTIAGRVSRMCQERDSRESSKGGKRLASASRLVKLAVLSLIPTTVCAQSAPTFTMLYSFDGVAHGGQPRSPLVQGQDGNFYGTTQETTTVFKITPSGALTTLWSASDGSDPYVGSGLSLGSDGNIYGAASGYGAGSAGHQSTAMIYEITSSGAINTLYSVVQKLFLNPVTKAADGNIYGTTNNGGSAGYGSVYVLTPQGQLTTLYSFTGGADGQAPIGRLIQSSDGNFYGITSGGGGTGTATMFKITPAGSFTVLCTFNLGQSGGYPFALIQAKDGNFYGVAEIGGASALGAVFKVTPAGALTTLYTFSGSDGYVPDGITQGSDGNFYGTTYYGGTDPNCPYTAGGNPGCGTIFKLTTSGALTTLHSFAGGPNDGYAPFAGVTEGKDGNLYGTTAYGGSMGVGTAFQLVVVDQLKITSPSDGSNYQLTNNNYVATENIPFTAVSPDATTVIDWNLKLSYKTSGGKGASTTRQSFKTQPGDANNVQFTSMGGQLTVTATQSRATADVTVTITGEPIPDSVISSQLLSLYPSGATPDLLQKIAVQESSYKQFFTSTLYGVTGYWPHESFDGGSHIGLMQVKTNMANAFDWTQNAQAGANLFIGNLTTAKTHLRRMMRGNRGLTDPTPQMIEDEALSFYNVGTAYDYWTVIPGTNGNPPQWQENITGDPDGTIYADCVRKQTPPVHVQCP
jgi:uncharacterized repeat protein (TIGR03803 family)